MPAEVLIPVRFFGYDSIIYLVSALIGFWISHRASKLYEFTRNRQHFYLYSGFTVLSLGMLTLSLASGYSYFKYFESKEFVSFNGLFDAWDFGYWIYFITSFIGYLLLAKMYFPIDKKMFLIGIPLTFNYYAYFNVALFFLIAYVAFKSLSNYLSRKSQSSMLVAGGFILIALYHALQLFTFLSKAVYVFSNLALILGFLSLLVMLLRVDKK